MPSTEPNGILRKGGEMKTKEMERVFRKLEVEKVKCSHHVRGYYMVDGKKAFPVYFSFGSKDIPGFVATKIAKSMGLELSELVKMAKCKISKEEFDRLIRDRGFV